MAKRIGAFFLVGTLLLGLGILPVHAKPISEFVDVSQSDWFYEAVQYTSDNNLFLGTDSDSFSPELPMTRGMFVTVLGRLSKIDPSEYEKNCFKDVELGNWYAPYVYWSKKWQIVAGFEDGTFRPEEPITREQMAKLLYHYSYVTGNNIVVESQEYTKFQDFNITSPWAEREVMWAADKKLLQGDKGKLNPKGLATRAQVAQVLYKARTLFVETEKRYLWSMPNVIVVTFNSDEVKQSFIDGTAEGYEKLGIYQVNTGGMSGKFIMFSLRDVIYALDVLNMTPGIEGASVTFRDEDAYT